MGKTQTNLVFPLVVPDEAYSYGERASGEVHGVVHTKPHVVRFILDQAGYVAGRNLADKVLVEPSCGEGAFLDEVVGRLMASARNHGIRTKDLTGAIVAYDIDQRHVLKTRHVVGAALKKCGVRSAEARRLSEAWVKRGDFLLSPISDGCDFVVGNPPYVRSEQLAPILHEQYRRLYSTLFDRADLYVAFIERGLSLLKSGGRLVYVCADRWIANKYGAPLRKQIADSFCVETYVDLHDASPFESEVIAYPSIFCISSGKPQGQVLVGRLKEATENECAALSALIRKRSAGTKESARLDVYEDWFRGADPWVINSPKHLELLRRLEQLHPPLESEKTTVRIGVATGCDAVYIVPANCKIESSRKLPLVMRDDIEQGRIKDGKRAVINVFADAGGLVDLNDFPQLRRYLESHGQQLKARHVAKKSAVGWYRTIDRVYPELVARPKLLIPDIAGSNEVVFDEGAYFPHHNLYYVISEEWDLEVLGGLLSSKVALFFVWSYAVKMRGGYLRFQAQYLRKIRVPRPQSVPKQLGKQIKAAFRARDFKKLDGLAVRAYGMDEMIDFDFVDTRN